MGRFRTRCLATGVALLLVWAETAAAKERPPSADQIRDAAEAFDHGRTAFRAKGYVEAAESFEAADTYAPSAQALLLAIKSRASAEQVARALTLATFAVNKYPEDEALQEEARKLLETHAEELGKLNVACDEPCDLLLDGKLVHGRADVQRTVYVDPGMHRIRASWSDGRAKSLGVRIDAGGFEILNFEAGGTSSKATTDAWLANKETTDSPEAPQATGEVVKSSPKSSEKGGLSPAFFWTGVGLTGVGVGVSTLLGVRAITEPGAERVAEACQGQTTSCPEYQEGVRNQTAASVSIGVTLGVAALTVITGVWFTDWKGKESSSGAALGRPPSERRWASQRRWEPVLEVGDGLHLGARGRF